MNNCERIALVVLECALVSLVIFALTVEVKHGTEDEVKQQTHYCLMVKMWENNKHLPKENRPGWPAYNGKEQCNED